MKVYNIQSLGVLMLDVCPRRLLKEEVLRVHKTIPYHESIQYPSISRLDILLSLWLETYDCWFRRANTNFGTFFPPPPLPYTQSLLHKWRHIYEVVYAKAKPLPSPSLRTYYVHKCMPPYLNVAMSVNILEKRRGFPWHALSILR